MIRSFAVFLARFPLALFLSAGLLVPVAADEPEGADANAAASDSQPRATGSLPPLMQRKLERSKEILEGLALEDYEKISSNAQALHLLSLESGWNIIQTEEYATQSRDFRRTSKLIAEAAREKDLGRATLGYVALTVRCVECHNYMREHEATRIPGNPSDAE